MRESGETLAPRPDAVSTVPSLLTVVICILFVGVGLASIVLVSTHSMSLGAAVRTLLAVYAALILLRWVINRVSARRFHPHNEEAVSALVRGELDRAARVLESWTRRGSIGVRCVARHNLALARARHGDVRGAIRLLADNERRRLRGTLRSANATQLALCLALVGALDLAEAWVVEAEQRAPHGGRGQKANAAHARALLDCRRGNAKEAARAFAAVWPEIEGQFGAFVARPVRVVHAFAMAQVTGPRDAGVVANLLTDARPRFPGEYDWLATAWPEMRVFLKVNDLAGKG